MKPIDFIKEDFVTDAHEAHQDHEVQMARADCYTAAKYAIELHKLLKHITEQQGLDGWVSEKITLANDYLRTVHEYLTYEQHSQAMPGFDPQVAEMQIESVVNEGAMDSLQAIINKIKAMPGIQSYIQAASAKKDALIQALQQSQTGQDLVANIQAAVGGQQAVAEGDNGQDINDPLDPNRMDNRNRPTKRNIQARLGHDERGDARVRAGQERSTHARHKPQLPENAMDDNAIWSQYGQYNAQDLMQEFPNLSPKDAQTIVNYAEYGWSSSNPQKFRNEVVQRVKMAMGQQSVAEGDLGQKIGGAVSAVASGGLMVAAADIFMRAYDAMGKPDLTQMMNDPGGKNAVLLVGWLVVLGALGMLTGASIMKKGMRENKDTLHIPDSDKMSDSERHQAIMAKHPDAARVGKTPGQYKTKDGKLISGIRGVRKLTKEAGYEHGFADPNAPKLGGRRQNDEPDAVNNIAIAIDGKTWKVFAGRGPDSSPAFFKQKQSVDELCKRKSRETGKKWTWGVTGAPATNESTVNELSSDTLSNYVNRAVDDVADRSKATGVHKGARVAAKAFAGYDISSPSERDSKIDKRKVGISRAVSKMGEMAGGMGAGSVASSMGGGNGFLNGGPGTVSRTKAKKAKK